MAERQDDIFIYLQAIGADSAARQIEDVADSVDKLNNANKEQRKQQDADTRAMNAQTRAREQATRETRAAEREAKKLGETTKKAGEQAEGASHHWFNHDRLMKQIGNTYKNNTVLTGYYMKRSKSVAQAIINDQREIAKAESDRVKAANKELADGVKNEKAVREKQAEQRQKDRDNEARANKKAADDFERTFRQRMGAVDRYYSKLRSSMSTNTNLITKAQNKVKDVFEDIDITERKIDKNRATRSARELARLEKERKKLSLMSKAKALGNLGVAALPSAHIRPYIALIGLLISALPMIGTFFNALGAGVLALAGGLGQLSGVLGAIPAGMLAAAQGVGVFAIAFKGLGKAMTDQKAFAQLGPEAQNLVLALNNMKEPLKVIQNNVREGLLQGLGIEMQHLGQVYLPMVNSALTKTAKLSNTALRNFTGWMQSKQGRSTVGGIMDTNAIAVSNGIDAGQRLLQVFLLVANAAGPMLRQMSIDLVQWSHVVDNWVSNNQDDISNFFMRGYNMFKGALSTIGNYANGMYNIIKQAAPLTQHIIDGISKGGEKFLKWTENPENVQKISDYFKEMQPNLDAIMHLAGSLATEIFKMSRSDKFKEFVDTLANTTVPKVAEALTTVADSGALTAVAKTIGSVADAVNNIAKVFQQLPPWFQHLIVLAFVFGGIIKGILGYFKGIGTAIGKVGTAFGKGGTAAAIGEGGAIVGGGGGGAAVAGGGAVAGETKAATAGSAYVMADGTKVVSDGKGNLRSVATGEKVATAGAGGYVFADGTKVTPEGKVAKTATKRGKAARVAGVAKSGAKKVGGKALGGAKGIAGGAGGIIAGVLALPLLSAIFGDQGTNFSNLTDTEKDVALKGGNLDRFFSNGGKGIVGKADQGFNGMGKVNSLDKAIEASKGTFSGLTGKYNSVVSTLSSFIGVTTGSARLKDTWSGIDTQLAALAGSGDKKSLAQAQAEFDKIRKSAIKAGMPMDELLDLFPQYKDIIEQLNPELAKASTNTQDVANGMAGFNSAMKTTFRNLNNTLGIDYTGGTGQLGGLSGAAPPTSGAGAPLMLNFAGGLVGAGMSSIVGEFGPEAAITRTGSIGLVGAHGPELFKAGTDTAIIPSSATFNPLGGNFGNAPVWAQEAYRGGSEGPRVSTGGIVLGMPAASADGNVTYAPSVNVSSSNASPAEIEAAVGRAIRKADRDRRERR